MGQDVPSPADQIKFLNNMQRLLGEGSFVATYKFALLHALADLSVLKEHEPGAELTLKTSELAEKFIELYWRQVVPFPVSGAPGPYTLRQNSGSQAAILSRIQEARAHTPDASLARFRLDTQRWRELVIEIEPVVRQMPLWRLQTVAGGRLDFLYPNVGKGSEIRLRPGVAYCFRAFYGLLTDMIRGAWMRLVRNYNGNALGDCADLATFLFGSERSSLSGYRQILMDVQAGRCLYCRRPLGDAPEVDHFIPWARYPVDLGHNFILAHRGCNQAKSDHLASEEHLEAWCERNYEHKPLLEERFNAEGILHDRRASLQIAHWAYTQVARVDGQVWVREKQFKPLPERWEDHMIPRIPERPGRGAVGR